jgi:putative ABC transport system substrate-binding protein
MKLKGILRAFFAVVVTSAVLLLIDLDNRKPDTGRFIAIAIFKIASRPVLDDSETGVIQSLKDKGFEDKKNCNIKKFCAEGDMAVANMIAQNILSSKFDMVITISTPALQVMANANKKGQMQRNHSANYIFPS